MLQEFDCYLRYCIPLDLVYIVEQFLAPMDPFEKEEDEKCEKNHSLRQDLDHIIANKSIVELWKWSMPVTNYYEEYQDKSHH